MTHDDSSLIGTASTLAVFALPPGLVDGIGKLLFAVFTAIVASVVSVLVKRWMNRRDARDARKL